MRSLFPRSPLREQRDGLKLSVRAVPALTRRATSLFFVALASLAAANPIRPLANDFVAVGESPDPQNSPLYSPSILALPGGRLVAALSARAPAGAGSRNPDALRPSRRAARRP